MAQQQPLKPMATVLPGFLNDSFTGASGALSGHTPEVGGAWAAPDTGTTAINLDGSGNAIGTGRYSLSSNAATVTSSSYTVQIVMGGANDGTTQSRIGPAGRINVTGKTGYCCFIQGNGYVDIYSLDWSSGTMTTGVVYNSFPTAYTFAAADTMTIHFNATKVWMSLHTAANGDFTSAQFTANAVVGEKAGIFADVNPNAFLATSIVAQ